MAPTTGRGATSSAAARQGCNPAGRAGSRVPAPGPRLSGEGGAPPGGNRPPARPRRPPPAGLQPADPAPQSRPKRPAESTSWRFRRPGRLRRARGAVSGRGGRPATDPRRKRRRKRGARGGGPDPDAAGAAAKPAGSAARGAVTGAGSGQVPFLAFRGLQPLPPMSYNARVTLIAATGNTVFRRRVRDARRCCVMQFVPMLKGPMYTCQSVRCGKNFFESGCCRKRKCAMG